MPRAITEEEFWSRKTVTKSGCWEWNRVRHRNGYGEQGYQSKFWLAHRLAWFFTHGEIPAGAQILHHCDNPPCINPAHLFLGSQVDNMRDMRIKMRRRGRGAGERNGRAVLTWAQVCEIRRLYRPGGKGGKTQVELSRMFGVTQTSISGIVRGDFWKAP